MNNLKRLKKLVLANKETRRLYRMMQFLAIFMVISCTIIIVVAKWIEHDQNQKREELFGSWDEVFLDVPAEDLNYFKQNAFLEQISIQSVQEKVFLEGDKRVVIGSCDDNFLEMGNIELLEGRMPEKENEVAVEEEYLKVLEVTGIGSKISLDSKISELKNYRVVGIVENYSKMWKTVNKDMNFINCFILGSEPKENQVYVKYGYWAQNDPEINRIEYRLNFSKIKILARFTLLKIIIGIMIMQMIIIVNILFLLKNTYIKKDLKRTVSKSQRIVVSLFLLLTEIILSFCICKAVTGIIVDSLDLRNIKSLKFSDNITLKNAKFRVTTISRNEIIYNIIHYISYLEGVVNEILYSILVILFLKFLTDIYVLKCTLKIKRNINYYYVCKYYRNNSISFINYEVIKICFSMMIIGTLILILFFVLSNYNINYLKAFKYVILIDFNVSYLIKIRKSKLINNIL